VSAAEEHRGGIFTAECTRLGGVVINYKADTWISMVAGSSLGVIPLFQGIYEQIVNITVSACLESQPPVLSWPSVNRFIEYILRFLLNVLKMAAGTGRSFDDNGSVVVMKLERKW
jgi:hypothetical protein